MCILDDIVKKQKDIQRSRARKKGRKGYQTEAGYKKLQID